MRVELVAALVPFDLLRWALAPQQRQPPQCEWNRLSGRSTPPQCGWLLPSFDLLAQALVPQKASSYKK